jgi:hypothetical protein
VVSRLGQLWCVLSHVGNLTAMRPRINLVSRRFVDLRRVASQMCRDTGMRMPGCP